MVLELAVAVTAPRPAAAAGVIVTAGLVRLTTPVMSSIRSSWPVARFAFWRGSVKELMTSVAPELMKLTFRVVPLRTSALDRLKSMPIPVSPPMVVDEVMMGAPTEALKETEQTALAGHWGVRLVMAAPVPLKKASCGLEKETVMVLLLPVGTLGKVPRKAESDCSRTRSTTMPLPLLGVKFVLVPVEEVRVMPLMVTLKLTSPRFAGGVSATRTRLTLAVPLPPPPPPPPPLPLGKPLQAPKGMHTTRIRKRKALEDFIGYPTLHGTSFRTHRRDPHFPGIFECNARLWRSGSKTGCGCPSTKEAM